MSKFNYCYMSNSLDQCVVFNKERWTKEEALLQTPIVDLDIKENNKLEVFSSFIQYGYFTNEDDEVCNGWSILDMEKPSTRKSKNQVEVWVVKELSSDE